MKLFVSYARIDKPYCVQLVSTLDVHDVWYDQRLYAGQKWWLEILRRLDWCEGLVYLLSPESVTSEYCLKELDIAIKLGRPIIPILIHSATQMPEQLVDTQYVDISDGLDTENTKTLLNSIYLAEQSLHRRPNKDMKRITSESKQLPVQKSSRIISMAAGAMQNGQYDRAVFLLKQAKQEGYSSQFINLDTLLAEAENALEALTRIREASREYRQILDLFEYTVTRHIALQAFSKFQKVYPEYDPENLKSFLEIDEDPNAEEDLLRPVAIAEALPMLKWEYVEGGVIRMEGEQGYASLVKLDDFWMSRYPITNQQYDIFLNDPDGYYNDRWWRFSDYAYDWFLAHPKALASHFKGDNRPRETVNWFEAVAFCSWLSHYIDCRVTLPTLAQWRYAATGGKDINYPWGNDFEKDVCNTRENGIRMTTRVNRYPDGRSCFGIYDLAGNVWEWTLDSEPPDDDHDQDKRAVIGGSFVSPGKRAQPESRYFLKPEVSYSSIGFRVVMLGENAELPIHLES